MAMPFYFMWVHAPTRISTRLDDAPFPLSQPAFQCLVLADGKNPSNLSTSKPNIHLMRRYSS